MGTVWLARRSDGRFEGVAAVKLLNLALLDAGGAARFRREGTVLARLRHPHIARLLRRAGQRRHRPGRRQLRLRRPQRRLPAHPGPNEFWVRAFGGIGLNTGVNIGCDLTANTGAWSCTSSKLVKEGFEDVDGEEILARLREIPIQRWRYIGTEARHLGPFAEDFHAAFGLGEDAAKIAQIDADGVALSAAQALERRTAALQAENAALKAETGELRRRIEALEGSGHPD